MSAELRVNLQPRYVERRRAGHVTICRLYVLCFKFKLEASLSGCQGSALLLSSQPMLQHNVERSVDALVRPT